MSFCRFSCNNWQSDVYCYEAVGGGYQIHVAQSRLDRPLTPLDRSSVDKWIESHKVQMQELKSRKDVPIGGLYDGQSFSLEDAEGCLTMLNLLKQEGYNVPQFAIDAMAEECGQ